MSMMQEAASEVGSSFHMASLLLILRQDEDMSAGEATGVSILDVLGI